MCLVRLFSFIIVHDLQNPFVVHRPFFMHNDEMPREMLQRSTKIVSGTCAAGDSSLSKKPDRKLAIRPL